MSGTASIPDTFVVNANESGAEPGAKSREPVFDGAYDADRAMRTIGTLRTSETTLKAQVAELAAKAQELDTLKESEKTELQKLTDQLATEKTQRETSQRETMRVRVALQKSLPAELVDRLQGETKEELSADADKLLTFIAPQAPGVPRASSRQGAPAGNGSLNDDPLLLSLKSKLGIS